MVSLRELAAKYGAAAVATYLGVSCSTFIGSHRVHVARTLGYVNAVGCI